MKKFILFFLLSGVVSIVFASAVITCKIKAKVIRQIPNFTNDPNFNKLEIKVLQSSFESRDTAGENCSKDLFSFEVK